MEISQNYYPTASAFNFAALKSAKNFQQTICSSISRGLHETMKLLLSLRIRTLSLTAELKAHFLLQKQAYKAADMVARN